MGTATWVVSGAVVVLALVVVVLAVVVVRLGRTVAELRTAPVETPSAPVEPVRPTEAEFLITRVGEVSTGSTDGEQVVPDRLVLSATLGEPLVRAAALTHGVRRALSAESRNRIGFAVRREIKRSRKVRRREMREAWRAMKAERAQATDAVTTPVEAPDAGRDVA